MFQSSFREAFMLAASMVLTELPPQTFRHLAHLV